MKRQTLGETIAALRKEHGLTQLELAQKMGVTDKAVSKWERNISCPDIGCLPKLAETFGVSLDELLQVAQAQKPEKKEDYAALISTILKAIPIAMGAAVTVLCVLGALDFQSATSMLGIGLFCAGLALLRISAGNN